MGRFLRTKQHVGLDRAYFTFVQYIFEGRHAPCLAGSVQHDFTKALMYLGASVPEVGKRPSDNIKSLARETVGPVEGVCLREASLPRDGFMCIPGFGGPLCPKGGISSFCVSADGKGHNPAESTAALPLPTPGNSAGQALLPIPPSR